jgi:hypothetical protein
MPVPARSISTVRRRHASDFTDSGLWLGLRQPKRAKHMRDKMHRATLAILVTLPFVSTAAAQNVAIYDGTYTAVSVTVEKYGAMSKSCTPPNSSAPATLTVSNGVGKAGNLEGTVSPQGAMLFHNRRSNAPWYGQIDAQGNATAKVFGAACVYTAIWRKAAR